MTTQLASQTVENSIIATQLHILITGILSSKVGSTISITPQMKEHILQLIQQNNLTIGDVKIEARRNEETKTCELLLFYTDPNDDFAGRKYSVMVRDDGSIARVAEINKYQNLDNSEGSLENREWSNEISSVNLNPSSEGARVAKKVRNSVVIGALPDPGKVEASQFRLDDFKTGFGKINIEGVIHQAVVIPVSLRKQIIEIARKTRAEFSFVETQSGDWILLFPYYHQEFPENQERVQVASMFETEVKKVISEVRLQEIERAKQIKVECQRFIGTMDPRLLFCSREYFLSFFNRHYSSIKESLRDNIWNEIEANRKEYVVEFLRVGVVPRFNNRDFRRKSTDYDPKVGGNQTYLFDNNDPGMYPRPYELFLISPHEIYCSVISELSRVYNLAIAFIEEEGSVSGMIFLDNNYGTKTSSEGDEKEYHVGNYARVSEESVRRKNFLDGCNLLENNIRLYFEFIGITCRTFLMQEMQERVLEFLKDPSNRSEYIQNLGLTESQADMEDQETALFYMPANLFAELFLAIIKDIYSTEFVDELKQEIEKFQHDEGGFMSGDKTIQLHLAIIKAGMNGLMLSGQDLLNFFWDGQKLESRMSALESNPERLSSIFPEFTIQPKFLFAIFKACYYFISETRSQIREGQKELQAGLISKGDVETDPQQLRVKGIIGPRINLMPPKPIEPCDDRRVEKLKYAIDLVPRRDICNN